MGTQEWILVGVSGSPGSRAAVRYAAHEADRTGAALRVVHVTPAYVPLTTLYPLTVRVTSAELEAMGSTILREAVDEAQWYLPEERVDARLLTGDRASGLLEAGRGASALVLGQDRASNMRRIATGSLIASVAGRADVPVVTVPDDWAPSEPRGRIVVGLKNLDVIPERLVRGALELARRRDALVDLVHVWSARSAATQPSDPASGPASGPASDPASGPAFGPASASGAADAAAQDVRERVAGVAAQFPTVEVRVHLLPGDPPLVLSLASEEADLLVIARRARRLPSGHFGSTGRALLRGARCPIVVLPVAEEPAPDDAAAPALSAQVRR